MKVKELYTIMTDNGTEVVEEKPLTDCLTTYVIEAEEGKMLYYGKEHFTGAVHTHSLAGWEEVGLDD